MTERFGPWSSALDDGLSPHLSTFCSCPACPPRFRQTGPGPALTRGLADAGCGLRRRLRSSASTSPRPTARMMPSQHPQARSTSTPTSTRLAADSDKGIFAIYLKTATGFKVSDFEGTVRVLRDGRMLALTLGWEDCGRPGR